MSAAGSPAGGQYVLRRTGLVELHPAPWEGGWRLVRGKVSKGRLEGSVPFCSALTRSMRGWNDLSFPCAPLRQVHTSGVALFDSASRDGEHHGDQRQRRGVRGSLTYHHVMKEKLPGLAQFLVQQHVEEVVDEITCRERERERESAPWSQPGDRNRTAFSDKCVKRTLLP